MVPWLEGVFAGCVLLGVPISFALIRGCFAAIVFASPMPLAAVVQGMMAGVDSTPLVAIPLFVLFGEVMARSGIGLRIVALGRPVSAGSAAVWPMRMWRRTCSSTASPGQRRRMRPQSARSRRCGV
jgi:hypothetical protein